MKKKSSIIIIVQAVIIALLLILMIIQKSKTDRLQRELTWLEAKAMKVSIRAEKLEQELFELKSEN